MPADDYADPKKVREKKEKEEKVVQLAVVVHMNDKILLNSVGRYYFCIIRYILSQNISIQLNIPILKETFTSTQL